MTISRRDVMKWAAAAQLLPFLPEEGSAAVESGYRPALLPTTEEVWEWETLMAKLGPKYTGNKAHVEFVEWLAKNLKQSGLDVFRENHTFARWEERRSALKITPASGKEFEAPITSYFPYSGETSAAGVTGELVYCGTSPHFDMSRVQGKIALLDCPITPRPWGEWYQVYSINPPDKKLPDKVWPARSSVSDLTPFRDAGALGVILVWTNVSDANAKDQYAPFSRPLQHIPGLWVGHETGAKLRDLAKAGAKATVILEADIIPDTSTDTLIATLPGASSDEIIIVNTHTDGPNATEENGGVGIVALAKYFSKIPKAERKRTMVFILTTGHFAGPYVPSIRGVVEQHPELVNKAVAACTIEHLGCMEWADDSLLNYKATGQPEWSIAISPKKGPAGIILEAAKGSPVRNIAVANPVKGGFLGEGSALARAGIPTIGYMPMPSYLLAGPANGCIEKLSGPLMHSQIEMFAKVLHRMHTMSAAELKA
jgi:hypothetical protein